MSVGTGYCHAGGGGVLSLLTRILPLLPFISVIRLGDSWSVKLQGENGGQVIGWTVSCGLSHQVSQFLLGLLGVLK